VLEVKWIAIRHLAPPVLNQPVRASDSQRGVTIVDAVYGGPNDLCLVVRIS
jgi:hypothetical protein